MERLQDLVEISKVGEPNIPWLLEDAYNRGLVDGKEIAKRRMIEAIELEK